MRAVPPDPEHTPPPGSPRRARGNRTGGHARRAAGALASAALLLPLVSGLPAADAAPGTPGTGAAAGPDTLQRDFARAAAEYHVPPSVLLAVSYLQSRWDAHAGAPSVTGGYGPMHLTDAAGALADAARTAHHGEAGEDARGDTARPHRAEDHAVPAAGAFPERLRTLDRAAGLTGLRPEELRTDPAANVRGGAALLADAQRRLGRPAGGDAADWYGAVARWSSASDAATARVFADDVFEVIRTGARRTTDAGQRVALPAEPRLVPHREQAGRLGRATPPAEGTECPESVACESVPAPYQRLEGSDYGNHDVSDRPRSQKADFIVIHDTEATWEKTLQLIRDPAYVSWHYTVRSTDGHIAQHVPVKDVAWHAGNWYVNAKSVGIEHEGFLARPDAWYTEEMYRTSARLVRHLARKLDIPLDRQHILGHDNVPGTVPSTIKGMHTDPGPYWDWAHYFELMDRPFHPTASPFSGMVTIAPDYDDNEPVYTGCEKPGQECAPHGSGAVRLRVAPRDDAPLVKDVGLRPDGGASTTDVNDTGARASTGQQFAVADRLPGWTAVWYLGQRAWFRDPWWEPVALGARGKLVTPREGRKEIPVYGRAYPEKAAYPAGVPVQAVTPLPYKLLAGQAYVLGQTSPAEYLYANDFDPAKHVVVRGKDRYYEIQFGHRVAFVRADDVTVRSSNR
ncbi:N-acetylmuramoyl-L-alanine amidase [Streptomyces mobaraensis NBRC 13819 = DSM 40847]|uniref:N-acetylmuramoyl-L-alanine amidase n=1 Tax=Streptomyces mobaraensis (strain ATCC 29032 / DSM 40847 / JCM 4168 / NBRC 13819 / NCIMB 11159 / IPCR 16-22) TaxID=1223523 RepID=M3A6E0_STRM1|nr:amidase [Streptomyces mobaraensis NBRC 13819 = DSM 40847]QTT72555.1 N-acetylmuramoyl-L-alanine amidase [Streptomyces mobaraensis NBRC 13819 = DSM 40847]